MLRLSVQSQITVLCHASTDKFWLGNTHSGRNNNSHLLRMRKRQVSRKETSARNTHYTSKRSTSTVFKLPVVTMHYDWHSRLRWGRHTLDRLSKTNTRLLGNAVDSLECLCGTMRLPARWYGQTGAREGRRSYDDRMPVGLGSVFPVAGARRGTSPRFRPFGRGTDLERALPRPPL